MDVLVFVGSVLSIYLAGCIAEHRGRSFRNWAYIGAMIGPLAFPLVYLFPNLREKNGSHA